MVFKIPGHFLNEDEDTTELMFQHQSFKKFHLRIVLYHVHFQVTHQKNSHLTMEYIQYSMLDIYALLNMNKVNLQ